VAWVLLVGSLPAILVLTLTPGGEGNRIPEIGTCLICGESGVANIVRNILLFGPLGIALGVLAKRRMPAWCAALALTAFIELVQAGIPGRNPLLVDFAANGVGAGIGILLGAQLVSRILRDRPMAGSWASSGSVQWAVVASAVLASTGWLLSLDAPSPPYYVQWTPHYGHLEVYDGSVLEAHVGAEALAEGLHPAPDELSRELLGGSPLVVRATAAPPSAGTAPMLSVFNGEQEELFLLATSGKDLVVHLPFRSVHYRLAKPDLRLVGGLQGVAAGETIEVGFRLAGADVCLGAGGQERCASGPTLGQGWTLLISPAPIPGPIRAGLALVWLLLLAFPSGLLARDLGVAVGLGIGLVGVALGVDTLPWLMPRAPVVELGALLAGAVGGWAAWAWLCGSAGRGGMAHALWRRGRSGEPGDGAVGRGPIAAPKSREER
jgi:hypothetical protein